MPITYTKNPYVVKEKQSIYDLSIMYGYGLNVVDFLKSAPDLVNLNNINIKGIKITVTKQDSVVSNFLVLQKLDLATNIDVVTGSSISYLLTDDGFYLQTDSGDNIVID